MDVPQHVIRQLAALTVTPDEPRTDLPVILAVLLDDLTHTVPSFLGLTLTVVRDEETVTLHVLAPEHADTVATSLLVPLSVIGVTGSDGTVILYAAQPGALISLADDTLFAYGVDGQVILDRHLPDPLVPPGVTGPAELDTIHQGIGVLIDHGHDPQQARRILHRLADRHGITLHAAAQRLIDHPTDPDTERSTDVLG